MALCLLQQKPLHCQLNVHMLNIKKNNYFSVRSPVLWMYVVVIEASKFSLCGVGGGVSITEGLDGRKPIPLCPFFFCGKTRWLQDVLICLFCSPA